MIKPILPEYPRIGSFLLGPGHEETPQIFRFQILLPTKGILRTYSNVTQTDQHRIKIDMCIVYYSFTVCFFLYLNHISQPDRTNQPGRSNFQSHWTQGLSS